LSSSIIIYFYHYQQWTAQIRALLADGLVDIADGLDDGPSQHKGHACKYTRAIMKAMVAD
jgi:hypothetical protein